MEVEAQVGSGIEGIFVGELRQQLDLFVWLLLCDCDKILSIYIIRVNFKALLDVDNSLLIMLILEIFEETVELISLFRVRINSDDIQEIRLALVKFVIIVVEIGQPQVYLLLFRLTFQHLFVPIYDPLIILINFAAAEAEEIPVI